MCNSSKPASSSNYWAYTYKDIPNLQCPYCGRETVIQRNQTGITCSGCRNYLKITWCNCGTPSFDPVEIQAVSVYNDTEPSQQMTEATALEFLRKAYEVAPDILYILFNKVYHE